MMKKLKSDETTLDRLSALPESVILHILAFLEMRYVVRTALLSKRWQHLWTTIPCLEFMELAEETVKTRNFVNRALMVWKGTKILKFKIVLPDIEFSLSLCGDIDLWLRFATERNVEELCLDFENCLRFKSVPAVYSLPQFVYSCSSITKLSVVGCSLQVHGAVHWHQLKSLTVQVYSVSEDVINKVVSGSPQLETFDLCIDFASFENFHIQSSSLKKLSIDKYICSIEFDPSKYTMLTIWAPNLEALVITGSPYSTCLMKDVSSLTDAKLDLYDHWDAVLGVTLRQILPNVEAITLSPCCFKVLHVMKDKFLLSPLPNVKKLRFSCDLIKSDEVVDLLQIFPKLEMLDIDRRPCVLYPEFIENISSEQDVGESINSDINITKSMVQLRIVVIGWHCYEESLFQFVEFFLKHATMLEKMVIQQRRNRPVESKDMMQAAEVAEFATILSICRAQILQKRMIPFVLVRNHMVKVALVMFTNTFFYSDFVPSCDCFY